MNIKDMPHVTVEQVLALRKAAIELEKELAELKASLPKVRADAVDYAISECIHNGADGQGWQSDLEQCAIQLEAGNE